MFFRHPPDGKALPGEDCLNSLLDLRALGEHAVTIFGSHVVQIDVYREPGNIEDEKIQGRSALEDQLPLKERVALHGIEQPNQMGYLFEHIRSETRRFSFGGQLLGRDFHNTSPHACSRTSPGITRFHSDTRRPAVRLARSR